MYVSYEFYSQTFGTTIPEADFPKVEAKAEAVIGYLTYINDTFGGGEPSVIIDVNPINMS